MSKGTGPDLGLDALLSWVEVMVEVAARGTVDIKAYNMTKLAGISVLAEQNSLDADYILMLKVVVLRQVESLPTVGVSDWHLSELYSLLESLAETSLSCH